MAELTKEQITVVSEARANVLALEAKIADITKKAEYEISLKEEEIATLRATLEADIKALRDAAQSQTDKIYDIGAKMETTAITKIG